MVGGLASPANPAKSGPAAAGIPRFLERLPRHNGFSGLESIFNILEKLLKNIT
jgi:hypothetical protein